MTEGWIGRIELDWLSLATFLVCVCVREGVYFLKKGCVAFLMQEREM